MFRRVLITTDGSELAEAAVSTAMHLGKPGDCLFRVTCVIEPGLSYGMQPQEAGFFDNDFYRRMRSEIEVHAKASADRVVKVLADAGFDCSVAIRDGNAAPEIVREATEWGADLVVLATHGRRGIRRALLGSVAGEVVHSSPCPVLLHRAKESKE